VSRIKYWVVDLTISSPFAVQSMTRSHRPQDEKSFVELFVPKWSVRPPVNDVFVVSIYARHLLGVSSPPQKKLTAPPVVVVVVYHKAQGSIFIRTFVIFNIHK